MLEIKLDKYENYQSFKDETNEKIENYIQIFEGLKNYELIDFFKEIQKSLFGKNEDGET